MRRVVLVLTVTVISLATYMLSSSYANDTMPSHVLIEEAYHSGKIDFEQEQLYKAYSLFDPSRLPKEFRSTKLGKCGTPMLKTLRKNFEYLSPETQKILTNYHIGSSNIPPQSQIPPIFSGPEETLSSDKFVVHYTLQGKDAVPADDSSPANGTPDYVDWVLEEMENVWNAEINTLGWLQPPSDTGEGGDTRYDIYLKDTTYYGWIEWERGLVGDNPHSSSVTETNARYSYMVINNDFGGSKFEGSTTLQNIQITLAHEFNHSIQVGYDGDEPFWFLWEGVASWMEDELYDEVNDNFNYLPGYFEKPDTCLPKFNTNWFYSTWIFFRYLSEHHGGNETIRSAWENAVTSNGMDAVSSAISNTGNNITNVFSNFAIANLLLSTCPQNAPYCYEEANLYKTTATLDIQRTINFTENIIRTLVLNGVQDNYSADYISLNASDNIEVQFQGTSPSASYGVHLVAVLNDNASVLPFPLTGSPLSGSVSVNADDYESMHVVVVNTTPTELCPSTKIYGAYAEETKILRYFRDTVLSQTPEGQRLIKAYYQWSPAILKAMAQNREFEGEIKEMIDAVLPLIQEEVGDIYLPVCPNRSYRISVSPLADMQ